MSEVNTEEMIQTEAPAEDQEDQAAAILEGLLFLVGDDGITAAQAAQTMDISEDRVRELFDQDRKSVV